MKFKQDIWTKVKNHMKDTAEGAVLAFEEKRDEIERDIPPEFATKQLTQEQIRRSGRIGIVAGFSVILLILFIIFWWFWGSLI